MRISFDMDGVLADGRYIPKEQRIATVYAALPPLVGAVETTRRIAAMGHTLYIISSRVFNRSTITTRRWLGQHGFPMCCIGGVLTKVPACNKLLLADMLGITYHVDDNTKVLVANAKCTPILIRNPNRPPEEYEGLAVPIHDTLDPLIENIFGH